MKVAWRDGSVTASWDRPSGDASAVLVLGHGAGGDLNDRVLAGVAHTLAQGDIAVLRFNFPYRDAGRRAPGAQRVSEECYRDVIDVVRDEGLPIFCGGKSYGGRIASHIVADGVDVHGLVLLSYPLHPPGRTEKLRDEHLPKISVPMLFIQGTKDTFAQPNLLEATLARLPNASHVPIEGGEHSLRVRGRKNEDVIAQISDEIAGFVAKSR